ncbi:monocarboxylate transporter 13-like [Ptychodera flava]|uniref:monocarboxylate transporter 13-like n=1 Tax=Ptychodera flava TaxID=63121 RepID=UPI00396A47CD
MFPYRRRQMVQGSIFPSQPALDILGTNGYQVLTIDNEQKHSRDMQGCYSWIVVLGSHVCCLFVYGWYQAIGPLFVAIQHYFEETSARTSWILAVFLSLEFGIGPVSNVCVKKFGFRVTVMIGTVMSSIGFFISAFATRIEFLYFSIGILAGIGYGLILPPHIGIISLYINKHFALANSLAMSGSAIGIFVFPPLMQYLIDSYGWRGAVIIFSGINAHMGISAALYRTPASLRLERSHDVKQENKSEVQHSNICRDQCEIWDFSLFRQNPLLSTFTLANLFGIGVGYQSLPAHLLARADTKSLGSQNQLAFLISFLGLSSLVGRWVPPLIGCISKNRITSNTLFGLSLLLTGIMSMLSSLATTYATYAVFACFVGFLSGLCFVVENNALKEIAGPENLTASLGFAVLAMSIGGIIGPPTAGYIYDVTGDYNNSFYFYGAFLMLGGLIAILPEAYLAKRKNASTDMKGDHNSQEMADVDAYVSRSCYVNAATQTGKEER